MSRYLPTWAPAEAAAAVDDLVAYVDTMTLAEVVGSLRCINNSLATTTLTLKAMPALMRDRAEKHYAMGHIAQRVLLDRAVAVHTGLEEAHEHCQGFFKTLADLEVRVIESGAGL